MSGRTIPTVGSRVRGRLWQDDHYIDVLYVDTEHVFGISQTGGRRSDDLDGPEWIEVDSEEVPS